MSTEEPKQIKKPRAPRKKKEVVKEVVKEVIDELEEKMEEMEIEIDMSKHTVRSMGKTNMGVYIFYKGNNTDCIKFIKDFQDLLEGPSQVMVVGRPEYLKLDNAFYSEQATEIEWFKLCFYKEKSICVRIKELPRYSARELIDKIVEEDELEDEFVEVKII